MPRKLILLLPLAATIGCSRTGDYTETRGTDGGSGATAAAPAVTPTATVGPSPTPAGSPTG